MPFNADEPASEVMAQLSIQAMQKTRLLIRAANKMASFNWILPMLLINLSINTLRLSVYIHQNETNSLRACRARDALVHDAAAHVVAAARQQRRRALRAHLHP